MPPPRKILTTHSRARSICAVRGYGDFAGESGDVGSVPETIAHLGGDEELLPTDVFLF